MNQYPSSPGVYTPTDSLGGPPPRRGRPWWVWVLGGCGGCAVLGLIAVVVLTAILGANVQNALKEMGPVTPQSVQQSLGSDVPIYPNSSLEMTATKAARVSVGVLGKVGGKKIGAMFRGIGAYATPDDADKIFSFYDAKLKKLRWTEVRPQTAAGYEQHLFRKGPDLLIVQVQRQQGTNLIMLMRGSAAARTGTAPAPGSSPE